ncbi:hypothetical protein GQ43DRAFT_424772 [Delitschia confertaspora ATCC 74209]|uniref:Amino acid permease/ SLC12A domain-containing protein n=1 Tax=Delitschia confertaspora ATCC 74209 TaxID=1513339 RepID=A0A9P4JG57_9PLEO|nr:hypothetical protein GQ43DRAFT_424772 [Delitschia confertaspora ATCC 74209]
METLKNYSSTDKDAQQVQEVDLRAGDYGADSELRRILSTRHITMIALGSSIGMGLWLGAGSSLAVGGPAAVFLGYLLAGSLIWSVSQSIAEMAVVYPLPSAFTQWTGKFVCPSASFALGWAYWFAYVIGIANEMAAIVTVLRFWTDKLPIAAWITIFLIVVIVINISIVSVIAEMEVIASTIKFGWIFVVIISLIVTSAGGGPDHETVGFRYWKEEPFINGFKGFLAVMPTCLFAMASSENCALVAAETANPRKSVPRAMGSVWMRLSLFYILGAFVVTINVNPKNPNLFGAAGGGTNTSPFVIAYRQSGLDPLAHMMNAVIFISVFSSGSIAGYAGSRILMGLANLGLAPVAFKKADQIGRPWYGLFLTLGLGGALAYLNVNQNAAKVFFWLSSLTSLISLFGWAMICLAHIRFRYTWKLQGRDVADLPYKSWAFPYAAYWGLTCSIVLIVLLFYLAVWPLGGKPNAKNFFATYSSVIAILALYLGARVYHRGPWWVKAEMIDLDANRRFYAEVDAERGPKKGLKARAEKAVGFVFS